MKIYFSHGKESGPWGSKIKRLADIAVEAGYEVDSINYTDTFDPDERADRLFEILKAEEEPVLLVGSSMGGYVSVVAAGQVAVEGIFLMAPALYIPGYKVQDYHPRCEHIEMVHGWSDVVIPLEYSIRFAKDHDCSLHLISGDHRLLSSMETVERLFREFLVSVK